ncbi:hypothetical protein N7540_006011 [Penicillium herquei]|nr:hypothetical protein N7540_006011 [Penicillium herquei]
MPWKVKNPEPPCVTDISGLLLLLIYKEGWNEALPILRNFPGLPIANPAVFGYGNPEITPELAIALATDIADHSIGDWTAFAGYKLFLSWKAAPSTCSAVDTSDNQSIWGNGFAKQRDERPRESDFGCDESTAIPRIPDASPAGNCDNDTRIVTHEGDGCSYAQWVDEHDSWKYHESDNNSEGNQLVDHDDHDSQNSPVYSPSR